MLVPFHELPSTRRTLSVFAGSHVFRGTIPMEMLAAPLRCLATFKISTNFSSTFNPLEKRKSRALPTFSLLRNNPRILKSMNAAVVGSWKQEFSFIASGYCAQTSMRTNLVVYAHIRRNSHTSVHCCILVEFALWRSGVHKFFVTCKLVGKLFGRTRGISSGCGINLWSLLIALEVADLGTFN